MTLVVTHMSSLEIWRAESGLRAFGGSRELPLASSSAVDAASRVKPTAAEIEALRRSYGFLSAPVHLVVPSASSRFRGKQVVCHVNPHMAEFPRGSFARMGKSSFLAVPSLAFVQLAEQLSFPQLIEVAFELCGAYRLDSQQPSGFLPAKPLASVEALRRRAHCLRGTRGANEALRALAYALDGSASPMETKLAMLLSLPKCLGGYGLPQPKMNCRIDVGGQSRKAAAKDYYVCDLFWPGRQIAVEYDSDAFHTGSERIASDAGRRNALLARGVTVVTITKRQVLDKRELDRAAASLAKALGRRQRAGRQDWTSKQLQLRASLLSFRTR